MSVSIQQGEQSQLVDDIVDFVMRESWRGKAFFKGDGEYYSREDILNEILMCGRQKTVSILVEYNSNDEMVGVVTGVPWNDWKIFYVRNILCIDRGVMARMLKIFRQHYGPGWKLAARRKDRTRIYNKLSQMQAVLKG